MIMMESELAEVLETSSMFFFGNEKEPDIEEVKQEAFLFSGFDKVDIIIRKIKHNLL